MKARIIGLSAGLALVALLFAVSFRLALLPQSDEAVRELDFPAVVQKFTRTVHLPGPPVREELRWTPEDVAAKAELRKILRAREPVQRIVYNGGKVMEGRIDEELLNAVVFTERFGENGEMTVTIPRDQIIRIESLDIRKRLFGDPVGRRGEVW